MNTQLLIGIAILGFALLLDIIGTAIPYWWVISSDEASINSGLFQQCVAHKLGTVCAAYTTLPGWWRGAQAMMVLSILALIAAVGLAILFGFIMKDRKLLGLLSALMGAAGAGLAILGVIIFGSKSSDAFLVGGLHAGFGLSIVAALVAIVGAIMMVLSRNSN